MPPYRNFVPMKSHGIAVEDAREAEATEYFRQVAEEAARERAVSQARGDRSILARIRRWWSPDKSTRTSPTSSARSTR
jgi:hypothetical protein